MTQVNIHQVVENLKNTIKGKEKYLAGLQECIQGLEALDDQGDTWFRAKTVVEFLEININELKVILYDVEQCAEQMNLMSWQINPERMGQ